MSKLKIGILTSSPKANEKVAETISDHGHEPVFISPEKLILLISEHPTGYDRAYTESDSENPLRLHSSKLDAIIPRVGSHVGWAASCLRFLNENMGIWTYNSPFSLILAQDKSFTLQRLSSAKIRVPKTLACVSPQHLRWIVEVLGLPVVVKTNWGSCGKGVAIVDTVTSANSVFEFLFHQGLSVILEEFIPTEDFSDIRAWVVNDSVPIAMKRTATKKGEIRANISIGGSGERIDLSNEEKDICVKAAKSLGLGVCGVDLIRHKDTGNVYCLEVNANPGLAIIDLCKYNVLDDVVSFVERECKKPGAAGTSTSVSARHDLLMSVNLMSNIDQLLRDNEQMKTALIENLKVLGKSL